MSETGSSVTWLTRCPSPDGKVKAKPKHALPESLRKDLAAFRLQVAMIEIAKHPAIALDLLAFQAASEALGKARVIDGPDVEFNLPKPGKEREASVAEGDLGAIRKALPIGWLKGDSEAKQFTAFRSLPEAAKLELLAYCVALTLQPKLGPVEADEATAYDAALSLTGSSVAGYWRPAKGNFLSRINREQLLAVGRDVLGDHWVQSHTSDKKTLLVEQIDRAFSNPEKSGRTPDQIAKLKSWLPQGMAFDISPALKPAKAKKARKAA